MVSADNQGTFTNLGEIAAIWELHSNWFAGTASCSFTPQHSSTRVIERDDEIRLQTDGEVVRMAAKVVGNEVKETLAPDKVGSQERPTLIALLVLSFLGYWRVYGRQTR